MRQNAFNFTLFLFLAGLLGGLFWYADKAGWLPKADPPKKDQPADGQPAEKPTPESIAAAVGAVSYGVPAPVAPAAPPKVEPKAPPPPPPPSPEPPTLIRLGGPGFYNQVLLTNRGGGIQQVVLPKFDEANRLGEEVRVDGQPYPLHLIPGVLRPRGEKLKDYTPPPTLDPGRFVKKLEHDFDLAEPSYTLFHYPDPKEQFPDPLLGSINWRVVAEERPEDGPHRVVFETELGEPYFMKITKTYTLAPKDYHVGLKVQFTRLPGGKKGQGLLRYQMSGPRGLPIEGEWYTSTYRVALIGWQDYKGRLQRQYEDAATVAHMRGGDEVGRANNQNTFKYAAISTQYFTSALAIDDQAAVKNPWDRVRATTELPFGQPPDAAAPYFEDVTFRAVSEPLDLNEGESVEHGYVIYNGPAKVRLLKLLAGDRAVDHALVDRYLDNMDLRTVTDFRSPTALGRFADAIYWTDLVIVFTNLMHWLLGIIHWVIPNWGVSIIVLTILVRLCLFVPSRKQTQMNLRMMEIQKKLKPELDKLHEKYKDDFQTYNREKTRLMMQHGMNPFAAMGGCLLLFAQMPIMMGLYFCLQESIFFRLDHFLWIANLAAPDMTLWWGETIPYISTPEDIGSFYYLGPYLNILPLLAVGLMMYQQHKMMPPPTDEQMAAQQRMMKIMMIMMAVLFYKVAAGLALYFTISTLWGIVERQFIPKPKVGPEDTGTTGAISRGGAAGPVEPPKAKGLLGRFREAMQKKMEELQKQAEEQSSRQIRNNPDRRDPIRNPDRGDKKKKRRK
jgi:YidC/Oxa1 family membrane protein insertase